MPTAYIRIRVSVIERKWIRKGGGGSEGAARDEREEGKGRAMFVERSVR